MSIEFAREVVTVGGRGQTVLTRDGRVWAMVDTDRPTAAQDAEAQQRASERYANR
jgi:hypothetical protein